MCNASEAQSPQTLHFSDSHTLSVSVASQSSCASSSLTIPAWPCSLAHINAVDPSSSCTLTCAPCARRACTMSILPWLTASISAVWPAWANTRNSHTHLVFIFSQNTIPETKNSFQKSNLVWKSKWGYQKKPPWIHLKQLSIIMAPWHNKYILQITRQPPGGASRLLVPPLLNLCMSCAAVIRAWWLSLNKIIQMCPIL